MQRLHNAPLSHGRRHLVNSVSLSAPPGSTTRPLLGTAHSLPASSRSRPRPPQRALLPLHVRRLHTTHTTMAQNDSTPEWGAARVRSTFLDYFKERGHTFGEFCKAFTSIRPSLCPTMASRRPAIDSDSALLLSRPPLRPDSPLRQCWHEPVQGHLPRHR